MIGTEAIKIVQAIMGRSIFSSFKVAIVPHEVLIKLQSLVQMVLFATTAASGVASAAAQAISLIFAQPPMMATGPLVFKECKSVLHNS